MSGMPLSQLMRTATRPEHEHAETRSFVTDLMTGALTRDAYLDLAQQHFFIYTSLEHTAARFADDPAVGRFVLPELIRLPSIEADLDTLVGPSWREDIVALPATQTYAATLDAVATAPELLAHTYTRYLGDLSGGQAIATMLRRHYGFTPAELTFYTFTGIEKVKIFKDQYRDMMDEVPFTAEECAQAAAAAKVAFELNAAVFNELGANHSAVEGVLV